MTPSTWERAKQITADALEAGPDERASMVAAACGEDEALRALVMRLLAAHDEASGFLEWDARLAAPAASRASSDSERSGSPDAVGSAIGPYTLIEILGQGGMGTVWLAEQTGPVKRHVALKIIKVGMDTAEVVARFDTERQALAVMDHPNIAKVFDAGATPRGRPYFAMEFIHGAAITKYADDHRLSIRDRIALFIEVCRAIEHAHQKGVIHRDIKPSNLLVSVRDGVPHVKVIDFGIAKAIGAPARQSTRHTRDGQVLGTPEYISPEQASPEGDVDTRADIYSLGVVLYELLTGTGPYNILKRGIAFSPALLGVEPMRPSARLTRSGTQITVAEYRSSTVKELRHELVGDLDWIILRAIDKDRARRYTTATALAEDLERYLHSETVQARPPSAVYRMRKFTRRHRAGVAAAAALLLVSVAGTTASSVGFVRAEEQAEIATSRELVAASINQLDNDPELSLLLAIESAKTAPTLQAEEALQRVLESRLIRTVRGFTGSVYGVGWGGPWTGPSLRVLAAGREPVVRDMQTGEEQLAPRSEAVPRVMTTLGGTANLWAADPDSGSFRALTWVANVDGLVGGLDGPWMARAAPGGTVVIQRGLRGPAIRTLRGHTGEIYSLMSSPDGRTLASSAGDGTVKLWDTSTWRERLTIPVATMPGNGLAFSPDSRLLSAGGRLWDVESGAEAKPLGDGINHVAFNRDGSRLATGADDGTVTLWEYASGRPLLTFVAPGGPVTHVAFSPDGEKLATAGTDGAVRLWNVGVPFFHQAHTSRYDYANSVRVPPYPRLAVDGGGTRLAISSSDGTTAWDVETRSEVLRIDRADGGFGPDPAVAFSPDGRLLATTANGVQVWDVDGGSLLADLRQPLDSVMDVEFSPSGELLATGSRDGIVRIWDAKSGTLVHAHRGKCWYLPCNDRSRLPAYSVAFSSDGKQLAMADGRAVWLGEVRTGEQLRELAGGPAGRFVGVAFSPDGKRLATAGDVAGVWDLTTGERLYYLGHQVSRVSFSPDGARLLTVSTDGSLRLWDARDGLPIYPIVDSGLDGRETTDAAFTDDGRRVFTVSTDLKVGVFPQGLDALLEAAEARRTRRLTEAECQRFLHVAACPGMEER